MEKRRNPVIAVAQIKYFVDSSRNNLEKIKKYINIAKDKKADIICFPESCVHRINVLTKKDKLIKEIREECKKNKIWCIITEDIDIKDKVYNTALLIDREGKIHGDYKKIHLYGDKAEAGRRIKVFDTDFGKIGIAICWDLAFPELFKKMKNAGAEIVFCPSQWWYDTKTHEKEHKKRELKILESLVRTRAYENVYFVAICNPVMESKYQVSYSAIVSPTKILNRLIRKEGIITAKVNLNQIQKIQKIYDS